MITAFNTADTLDAFVHDAVLKRFNFHHQSVGHVRSTAFESLLTVVSHAVEVPEFLAETSLGRRATLVLDWDRWRHPLRRAEQQDDDRRARPHLRLPPSPWAASTRTESPWPLRPLSSTRLLHFFAVSFVSRFYEFPFILDFKSGL